MSHLASQEVVGNAVLPQRMEVCDLTREEIRDRIVS